MKLTTSSSIREQRVESHAVLARIISELFFVLLQAGEKPENQKLLPRNMAKDEAQSRIRCIDSVRQYNTTSNHICRPLSLFSTDATCTNNTRVSRMSCQPPPCVCFPSPLYRTRPPRRFHWRAQIQIQLTHNVFVPYSGVVDVPSAENRIFLRQREQARATKFLFRIAPFRFVWFGLVWSGSIWFGLI